METWVRWWPAVARVVVDGAGGRNGSEMVGQQGAGKREMDERVEKGEALGGGDGSGGKAASKVRGSGERER
ncbi:hypothetical protein AAC387_Pa11g0091 [Persea americana]